MTGGRLVYPGPPGRRQFWSLSALAVVMFAGAAGIAWWWDAWALLIGPLLVNVLGAWLTGRQSTRVTAADITVRTAFRTRTRPVGEFREIVHPGRFGRHVLLRPQVGHTWQLPRVTPDDIEDIRALTGLPVRVSERPE
ncbi:6TM ABC transporter family protein [Kineosporia succinea]|uniref:PH (Pleckstrin Homology) domain-containing protein n=1 Tax=Kineosporia succinea TaxID=84632 RepID=A0ABT9PD49_9ACTN|nr:hypothetical protein [Kineosporia succinea]MDP9830416.1 hypothetical protein [Kineosporia succinea]